MEKSFEELRKEYNSILMSHVCYEKGCLALFGTPEVADVQAAIVKKGAEALMAETTWMFKCDTSKGYEEWCKQKIKPESLPEYITLEAYKGALKHELTALYNKEKAEHEVQQ